MIDNYLPNISMKQILNFVHTFTTGNCEHLYDKERWRRTSAWWSNVGGSEWEFCLPNEAENHVIAGGGEGVNGDTPSPWLC